MSLKKPSFQALLGLLAVSGFLLPGGCKTVDNRTTQGSTATAASLADVATKNTAEIQPVAFKSQPKQSTETPSPESELVPIPEVLPENADPQPLEFFEGMALENHPRIRAARARVAAASHRVPQARALEDPMLNNSFWPISDQSLQTAAGRAGLGVSFSQKYPWPSKRDVKAAVASREVQIAQAKLEQVELEIVEAVRLAYFELWFAGKAIQITESNREIAAELIKLAQARNSAGGSQQDVLSAQLQVDLLDDRLVKLRLQQALAQADLAALVGRPAWREFEPVSDIETTSVQEQLDALFAAAEQCSPRLREKLWAVSRDRQKRQLACLDRYPDFTLGAGWTSMTESDAISPVADGHDAVNFTVGVTLPLWKERIAAAVRESSANVVASRRELADSRDDTFRQLRRLSDQALCAEQQLRLYQSRIIPRAKQTLQIASADYRGGLVDFGEVADGFSELFMFELQTARARATLAGSIAQIERVVGCEVASQVVE